VGAFEPGTPGPPPQAVFGSRTPPMTAPLPTLLRRWSSATNRRRLFEELARAVAWLLAAGVIAIGIDRLPHLLASWSLPTPSWLDDGDGRRTMLTWAFGAIAIAVIVRAALRFRRLRTKPFQLARELDRKNDTRDLLATAWSIETGAITPDAA